jgi:hypothetical protein
MYLYIFTYVSIYCTMLGVLARFCPNNCPGYATENTVLIVDSFIPIPITRSYNHTQLLLTILQANIPFLTSLPLGGKLITDLLFFDS